MNKIEFNELFKKVVEKINHNVEYENIYYNYFFDEKDRVVLVFEGSSDEDKAEKLFEEFGTSISQLEGEGHLYAIYSDDCYHCDCCGYLVHINHYAPRTNHWLATDGIYCIDCVKEEMQEEYVESLVNSFKSANTLLSEKELEEYGYRKLNKEFAYGLHNIDELGSSPIRVLELLKENGYDNVIFSIEDANMFETTFSVYVKVEEEEEEE